MAAMCHVRSVSLPSRSHPSSVRFEEELNKLKRMEIINPSPTSTSGRSICIALSGLESLYNSLDDVLNLAISTRGETIKCLNGTIIDGSDKVLDICSILVDSMLQTKEQVRSIQSALRRRKDGSSIEAAVKGFACFRKQLIRKTAKKLVVAELRQMIKVESHDHHHHRSLPDVVRALSEVDLVTRFIFQAVLAYLSVPINPKAKNTRWSSLLVSKVLHKGTLGCEEIKQENLNEIVLVDASLSDLGIENLQVARERLEELEITIEGLEKSLESVFRRLMKTRASLLNIMSQ